MIDDSMFIAQEAAPVRKKILVRLRQSIVEGRFQPGERLYEQQLCAMLGVSRSPVREALRQLESEKLVSIITNKGPVVAELSAEEVGDLVDVHEVLACRAIELFIQCADKEAVASLKKTSKEFDAIIKEEFSPSYLRADDAFFEILLRGCGNKVIRSLAKSLYARLSHVRRLSLSTPERAKMIADDFKKIADYICKRDTDAAVRAMSHSLRQTASLAISSLQNTSLIQDRIPARERCFGDYYAE